MLWYFVESLIQIGFATDLRLPLVPPLPLESLGRLRKSTQIETMACVGVLARWHCQYHQRRNYNSF